MDLTQKKLSKSEWLNVEVPFPDREKAILQLITDGYNNPNIFNNESKSIHAVMKLETDIPGLQEYLYKEYFEEIIIKMVKKYPSVIESYSSPIDNKKNKIKLKKSHIMRINNVNKVLEKEKSNIFEYILLDLCEQVFKYMHTYSEKYAFYIYTLINLKRSNVALLNPYCLAFMNNLITILLPRIQMRDVINQSHMFIEKNPMLLKYEDMTLYQHQRDIYNSFRYTPEEGNFTDSRTGAFKTLSKNGGKLVLYTAPTGTGKTLTPLGLSQGYRIIFICAARHVGLALAKSAVCMGKKIAIAFGCETASDIRLHYYAASEYTVNKRTGGIGKVDNTVGDKVEIMICDIKSYIIAMRYMMAFTPTIKDNQEIDENIKMYTNKIEYLDYLREEFSDLYEELKLLDVIDAKQQFINKLQKELSEILSERNTEDLDYKEIDECNDQLCILQTLIKQLRMDPLASRSYEEIITNNLKDLCTKRVDILKKKVQYKSDVDIITYWDEPTISMDYDNHPLHDLIKEVWCENKISKMVLSCATLPQEHEIMDSLKSFKEKFPDASIETISSFDCKKSISLLNDSCKAILPHLLYSEYNDLSECIKHCNNNKSLLRYFDLQEIVNFINKIHSTDNAINENMHMNNYFENGIEDITMNNIKLYYLRLLQNVNKERWYDIHSDLVSSQKSKFIKTNDLRRFSSLEKPRQIGGQPLTRIQSVSVPEKKVAPTSTVGLQITTTDAHTLTDGPTIFLSDNVENLGKYYIKQTNLPERIYNSIYSKIQENTNIQKKLTEAENQLEYIMDKMANANSTNDSSNKKGTGKKTHKMNRDVDESKQNPELRKLSQMVDSLRSQIQVVNLDDVYIPNSRNHQKIWTDEFNENSYRPDISDQDVCDIMALDVDNNKKLLLLLGIGMFTNENKANARYMEIMKKLAYNQNLYIILASSDYIYGTNYQFCHGYIGKDLLNMTQQKTIQALGRIGRNHMQQEYSIRFRDNDMLKRLFKTPEENKEALVMNRLFV